MKINAHHHTLMLLVLSAGLIFWFGRLSVQYQIQRATPPVQSIEEINPKIPLIEITDIRDTQVFGLVNKPEIRIKSGEQVAVPDDDLQFSLNIEHLGYIGPKRPIVKVTIPEWANFVASKSGKYFYEIDEQAAKQLSPENYVFFKNEEEAIASGYKRREK